MTSFSHLAECPQGLKYVEVCVRVFLLQFSLICMQFVSRCLLLLSLGHCELCFCKCGCANTSSKALLSMSVLLPSPPSVPPSVPTFLSCSEALWILDRHLVTELQPQPFKFIYFFIETRSHSEPRLDWNSRCSPV